MFCECGCGRITAINKQSIARSGYAKGQHKRFIIGHRARLDGHVQTQSEAWDRLISPKIRVDGECWIQTASLDGRGYGYATIGGAKHRKVVKSHRISYELHKGPIPAGLSVMHSCDRPACVNPAHLSLGTQKDNITDMMRKGRHGTKGIGYKHGRYCGSKPNIYPLGGSAALSLPEKG